MNHEILKLKLIKLAKGAVIAGLGAALAYFADGLEGVDFGEWTPIVVAGFSVFVNAVRQAFFTHADEFSAGYVCGVADKEILRGLTDETLSD
jgi:hypothetical protein